MSGATSTEPSASAEEPAQRRGEPGAGPAPGDPVAPTGVRLWGRDLGMGVRFAITGGRRGWGRTLLTALGVAIGVAVLLLAASVPNMLGSVDERKAARSGEVVEKSTGDSLMRSPADTVFRDQNIMGQLLQPESASAPMPPGVDELPEPGEMVVSPALKELLESSEGKPLAERLDAKTVDTIGKEGLQGPAELSFYMGGDELAGKWGTEYVTGYQADSLEERKLSPALLLVVAVACAVLLMPVVVFITTAVRFGGEQRDRRLAALRLVGADAAATRRMAAGESLASALFGVLLGVGLFLFGRIFVEGFQLIGFSFLRGDVTPVPVLVVPVLLAVPAIAVLVTVLALRGIVIEPLGVVRQGEERGRRLWWRMLPPVLGMVLLVPMGGAFAENADGLGQFKVTAGVVLVLSGVALLLPWLVERLVRRLRGGPVSWQLAVRRLQLSTGTASRAVSGITVAVAGAIALQMLFGVIAASERDDAEKRDRSVLTALDMAGSVSVGEGAEMARKLRSTEGVRDAVAFQNTYAESAGSGSNSQLIVAGCADLRRLAKLDGCADGQVFVSERSDASASGEAAADGDAPRPGDQVTFGFDDPGGGLTEWKVPGSAREVRPVEDAEGEFREGVLATPGAIPGDLVDVGGASSVSVTVADPDDGELVEEVRTAFFDLEPGMMALQRSESESSHNVDSIERALLASSVVVLAVIAASMVVTTLEQLRDRRRQLSVLVAFGVRRRTLAISVLWQTAVPVLLGLGLAVVFGLVLGRVLTSVAGQSVDSRHWWVFLPTMGVGTVLIGVVTLLSMPMLWRQMRPEGLRTE